MAGKTFRWYGLGLLVGAGLIVASCGKDVCVFGQGDCAQELASSTLSLKAAAATVSTTSTLLFTAAGGTSPYTYSVPIGGGSLSITGQTTSTTVTYTPGAAGTSCIRVTDNVGATADRCVAVQ
jgi:hypothetical protein